MAAWKGVTLALAAAALAHPASALAHEGEDHGAAGTTPPVAAAVEATPAPGAQPAAPANLATPANAGVSADEAAANGLGTARDDAAVTPAVDTAHAAHAGHSNTAAATSAVAAPVPVASGGGTSGDSTNDATSFDATGAGAAAPAATPAGELPFTGPGDTILVIALAGMFAPIGVLLWCIARRSELRWLRRHLSAPRFQWTER
jgi:hypothetical protein